MQCPQLQLYIIQCATRSVLLAVSMRARPAHLKLWERLSKCHSTLQVGGGLINGGPGSSQTAGSYAWWEGKVHVLWYYTTHTQEWGDYTVDLKPTMAVHPTHNEISHPYIHVHAILYMHVHEQSYYIVHYIRRKEEGKEGRKKRTNTNNLQQPQRLRKIYMCTHSQLQQLRKIFIPCTGSIYSCTCMYD